jgi:nitrate reductase NapE component
VTVVETAPEQLLIGLDASAEADPAKERRKRRTFNVLVLTLIGSVQLGTLMAYGYAIYVFVLS